MSSLVKVLVILFVTAVVAGCKIAVIVVEGGEVRSIRSGPCLEGTICIVEVNDTNFSESFTAVPKPGWHFVKWNAGEDFFCGDSTISTCRISAGGFDGNEAIEAIIASDQTFYLMPIFEPGLATVTVDGREWAQVDQFTSSLSWNDINAVCPEGACSGILNGFDMTGWKWASVDDVIALFNHYIGSYDLRLGQWSSPSDCIGVNRFFREGWSATLITTEFGVEIGIHATGLVYNPDNPNVMHKARVWRFYEYDYCFFEVNQNTADRQKDYEIMSGWFWRPL